MDDDTKDEIVYEVLSDINSTEWQKTTSIESKAICLIGFVGILLVYIADLGFNCLKEIINDSWLVLLCALCLFSLVGTFYISFRALFYSKESILNKKYIIKEYKERNVVVLPKICEMLGDVIDNNDSLNTDKNRLLKLAVSTFLISVILIDIFTFYCAYSQTSLLVGNSNNSSNESISMCTQAHHFGNKPASMVIPNHSLSNRSVAYLPMYIDWLNFTQHKRY